MSNALNILDELAFTAKASGENELNAGAYSHAGEDECPVCKKKMKQAKIGQEPIFFCPDHRISFPVKV